MSSTYNAVPRPAAVLVGDGRRRLIRRRETIDDLLALEPEPRDETLVSRGQPPRAGGPRLAFCQLRCLRGAEATDAGARSRGNRCGNPRRPRLPRSRGRRRLGDRGAVGSVGRVHPASHRDHALLLHRLDRRRLARPDRGALRLRRRRQPGPALPVARPGRHLEASRRRLRPTPSRTEPSPPSGSIRATRGPRRRRPTTSPCSRSRRRSI